jgi:putative alpha-1,2-mannosidase
VRMLMETMYAAAPDGLQGNEDVGQMSAWYIMSSMGFYPVDPVSGNYVFGTPLFDHVVLQLSNGRQLEIFAHRRTPADQYILPLASTVSRIRVPGSIIATSSTARASSSRWGANPTLNLAPSQRMYRHPSLSKAHEGRNRWMQDD